MTTAQIRTWVSLGVAALLVVFGVLNDQVSFIAMGVGVLGAPSISVVVSKEVTDETS